MKQNTKIGILFILSALFFIIAGYIPVLATLGLFCGFEACYMASKQVQEE